MAKADAKTYEQSVALYEKLMATNPNVERKGVTMPYTSASRTSFRFRPDPSDKSLGYFQPSAKRGLTRTDFSDKAR